MTLSSTAVAARPRRRSALIAPVGVVLTLLAWLCLSAGSPALADTDSDTFLAKFEAGSLSAWSDTSGVTLSSDFAKYGDFGAEAVTTPTQGGYLTWSDADVPNGYEYARISGWVRVDSVADGEQVGLITVKNTTGEHHFDFFRDSATGDFRWDLLNSDYAISTMPATLGDWFYVQALVDFGGPTGTTYTAQVRINGIDQPSITSVDQPGATVKSAWFGGHQTGLSNVREYDSLRLDVGDTPFSFLS